MCTKINGGTLRAGYLQSQHTIAMDIYQLLKESSDFSMVGCGWYQFYLFLEAAITNCHKLRAQTMCVLNCCRCQESEIMRWSGQCFLQGFAGDFVLASSLPWLLVFLGLELLKLNVFLYLHFLVPSGSSRFYASREHTCHWGEGIP